jgi:hypothetical protein
MLSQFFGQRPRTETWQRTSAADPDTLFYVRDWGCKIGGARDHVATVLGLHKPREAGWIDGIIEIDVDPTKAFVVELAGATFVFAQGRAAFADFATRLTTPHGSAYTVFLDEKQAHIVCLHAVDGKLVREVSCIDGAVSEHGERGPNEPELGTLSQSRALDLAAAWGPDPRTLVSAAPAGWLYTR